MSGGSVANRTEAQFLRTGAIAGLLCVLVTAGCAGVKPQVSGALPQSAAPPAVAEPAPSVASPAPSPSPTPPTGAMKSEVAAAEPARPPAAPPVIATQSAPKAAAPGAKAPAKGGPAKEPAAQAPKKESVAPEVATKAPTLDLKSLEQRLTDTSAIGVLTKVALKNQVDDLLDQFRAYYQGKLKTTLAELRRPYDLLVLKVIALLQDSDPALATAIAASREAIWGILADPAKFATVS